MSRTLTLLGAGWESVRTTAQRGQRAGALKRLTQMLARPDVPVASAAEWHQFAGELALDIARYTTARSHLKAAARLSEQANTRFLLGKAWEEDPNGCDRRAAVCFKTATALEPTNPLYRACFGRAAARCGKVKLGAREMLAAAQVAPGDVSVLRVTVSGLLEIGKAADARHVLATARFLRPGDLDLAALWERVKFETARLGQVERRGKTAKLEKTRENTRYAQDAHFATEGDRVILPFVRLADDTDPSKAAKGPTGGTVRRDGASFPRPHLARFGARKADR
jgi:hypothetical protein